MGQAIALRTDYTAGEVRQFAKRAKDAAQARKTRCRNGMIQNCHGSAFGAQSNCATQLRVGSARLGLRDLAVHGAHKFAIFYLQSLPRLLIYQATYLKMLYLSAKSMSHLRSVLPPTSSRRVGRKGLINGSIGILGAKSEVVVIMPFDAFELPLSTPNRARTSSCFTRCLGL